MAVGILMNIACTQDQYDAVIRDLETAGAGAPPGRLYHVAGPIDGGWRVLDVWESPASFEAFAPTLLPITQKHAVPPFQPEVFLAHNIIAG